jgi:preprotein translocase subunit SecG
VTIISWTLGTILVISNLLLILLVLLHRGRGGGLSDLFGGGFSSSLGGSSLAERNLDRFTIAIAIIWASSVIGLGLVLSA